MVMYPPEAVIGVIPTARIKTGIFSKKTYTIVVTNRRLIFAEMTNDLFKRQIELSRARAKAQGKGLFGQWSAQLGASFHFAQRYLQMPPDYIAAETPGNFCVGPADVRQIKVDRRSRATGSDDDTATTNYLRITVEWASGKRTWDTDGEVPNAGQARQMLACTFGPLVR